MFFTYSFLYGLGASFIFVAAFLITAKNFRKFQHLAVGLVSLGGSVGVLIYGPMLQLLIDMVGWRGTYRVTSALLCLVCVCGASFSEPLDDKNGAEKSDQDCTQNSNILSNPTEQITAKDVNFAENRHLYKEKRSNSSREEEKMICGAKYASTNDMYASDADLKSSTLVTLTTEAGIQDVNVQTSKLIDFSVFKVPRFTVAMISITLMCFGHYTPQLLLVSYCLRVAFVFSVEGYCLAETKKIRLTFSMLYRQMPPNKQLNSIKQ